MKHLLQLPAFAALFTMLACACHADNDDYYTTAIVTVRVPDSLTVVRMQGTVTLSNTSNKQSYSSSAFQGTSVSIDILRGAYAMSGEGTVLLRSSGGTERVANFRVSSSYLELIDHPSAVSTDIIFM